MNSPQTFDGRFLDRVAIVTGGATGIGYGIARRLGAEGARIVVVDANGELGSQSIAEMEARGIEAKLVVGDVAEEQTAELAVETALSAWGRLDVLINNAGITGDPEAIWELPVSEMDRVYRTNLRAVYLFTQKVVPAMLSGGYGRIVNIASIAGKEGNPNMVPYSATKAAVIALTKAVGKELAETAVRVNCITPAVIHTALLDQVSAEMVKYMVGKIPMGRLGEIEEVSAMAAWLASEECSFSTGAVFDISGGRATY